MKEKNKIILYMILLIFGLLVFISQIFILQKPDGTLGLIICIISVELILGSLIKLYRLSPKFKNAILALVDILFSIS